jgi:hypothetical protein
VGKELSMKRNFGELSSGEQFAIVVRTRTKDRLRNTCFRGRSVTKAVNFSRWASVEELVDDCANALENHFRNVIENDLLARSSEGPFPTESFELDCGVSVGWASTDKRERYQSEGALLERFAPNRASTALRVRNDATLSGFHYAPRTTAVTFVCEVRHEDGAWVVVIHSIYPGSDIGELKGDVTEREGVVFFGWEHPGMTD